MSDVQKEVDQSWEMRVERWTIRVDGMKMWPTSPTAIMIMIRL